MDGIASRNKTRRALAAALPGPSISRLLPIFLTFLGDFTPDRLDSRSLQAPWEWENRVLLEEYYIFNVANPPEVE